MRLSSLLLLLLGPLLLPGCPGPEPTDDDDQPTPPAPLLGMSLLRAPIQIVAEPEASGLLGKSMDECDFDGDGRSDLVVSAPEAMGSRGLVGVFFGANVSDWTPEMQAGEADIMFDGTVGSRVGYGVACDDFDGDGRTDIAAVLPRWYSPQGDQDFSVAVWHASDEPWQDVHGIDEAALISSDLGIEASGFGHTAWMTMTSGDLDGDGAAEIVLSDRVANPPGTEVTDTVYILPGQHWEGQYALDDASRARLTASSAGSLEGGALLIADLDGSPGNELLIGEPFSGPMLNHLGQISLLREPLVDGPISDAAYAVIAESGEARAFGAAATVGDFDGDGSPDLAITGIEENVVGPEPHGSVWLYLNAGELSGTTEVSSGDGHIEGDPTGGYLGVDILRVNDRDNDGVDDLLVYQADLLDVPGTVWLLSGAKIRGTSPPEDAEIVRWRTPGRGSILDRVAVGDFDGDGVEDYVTGTPEYEARTEAARLDGGRVSVLLSGSEVLPEPETTSWVALSFWIRIAGNDGQLEDLLTLAGPKETVSTMSSDAVMKVDRQSDWLVRVTTPDASPTQVYGRAGDYDHLHPITLWPFEAWSETLASVGYSPDPALGHVVVGLLKRDGAGAIGKNATLSSPYEVRASWGNNELSPNSPITPGPSDRSNIYFVNVEPGPAEVILELEDGESCYPGPGGDDPNQAGPIEVIAGEFTMIQYYCNLNRL